MFSEKELVNLNGKSILVTGGTGSFGNRFIQTVFEKYPDVKRVVIYSRDELKQYEMANVLPQSDYPAIRYFIGDVRDYERLKMACRGIDYVVHTAALKQVPAAEYNPMEVIKTNVIGAENVINAAISTDVTKVIALSTDKAAAPINLYGASKLCADKLFVAANNMKGRPELAFSVVRYGNVIGSRGSVIPFFLKNRKNGKLPVTHEEMSRFSITLDEAVNFVLFALNIAWGGEIFVPKIPSFKIIDLVEAISPGSEYEVVGIRPGEKLHEDMITETDAFNTIDFDNYYVIIPSTPVWDPSEMMSKFKGRKVDPGFKYNSGLNPEKLSLEDLREQIRLHVDPEFNVKS